VNFVELRVSNPLLNALEDLGYVYPTPIQHKCYRRITSGADVIGIARTGTGKTIAYLLPIINELEYSEQKQPRIVIIVPTRELVIQVCEEAKKLCKYKTVRIKGVFGGANINTQKEYVYEGGADIIVGTPGRLYDIAVTGVLRFSNAKKVVIDEVDEMLSLGFRPQLEQILEMLPAKRQHLMFSSTLSESVNDFITQYFNSPEKVEVDEQSTPVEKINQHVYFVPNFLTKIEFLKKLISDKENFVKNLIFVDDKKQADFIFEKLISDFPEIGVIHSNKSQNFRFNAIKNFEKGKITSLIATDVVARGLDFKDISHVINLSPPEVPGDYIHRIGRTGRAGKEGASILMIAPYEQEQYSNIQQIAGANVSESDLPQGIALIKNLMEFEKTANLQKAIVKSPELSKGGGAFHTKSEKNQKTNSGSVKQRMKKKRR
jgi:ATP-dependent RNA helicase RhlE